MEFDRNYMNVKPMLNDLSSCNKYYQKCDGKMMDCPMMHHPYMHANYMHGWDNNMCHNNMCMGHMHTYDKYRTDMYNMQYMEPIENLCGKTYNIYMMSINKSMQKIMMENLGMMPKAISKEKFNKEMNDIICDVMKKEDEIKEIVIMKRDDEQQDETRAFCPFCHGVLRDTLGILFVTELLRNGCVSCY